MCVCVCRCGYVCVYAQQTDWSIPDKLIPSGTTADSLWLLVESKKRGLFTYRDLETTFPGVISKVDPPNLSLVLP